MSETWGKVQEVGIIVIKGDRAVVKSEVAKIAMRSLARDKRAQRWRDGWGKSGRHN